MKLVFIVAPNLIAAPAVAQVASGRPPPSTRDPASYEAHARTWETALAGLDAHVSSVGDPTPRQLAFHAWRRFSIERNIASAVMMANMQTNLAAGRRFDRTGGVRACRAFEAAYETYTHIDWTALGRTAQSELQLRSVVRNLQDCRDRHGAPADAAPPPILPPLPRPAPPPLGTLAGDGAAFMAPCTRLLVDEAVPLSQRLMTCEPVASHIPVIRAQYVDAGDQEVFVFESSAANMLVSLGLLQLQADAGGKSHACAAFEAAEPAGARLQGLLGYANMAGPFVDLVNRTLKACGPD